MNASHDMTIIGSEELAALRANARRSIRRRTAKPIHKLNSDPVQRILMVCECGTYICPHRHSDSIWEMIILIEGEIDVLLFDKIGLLKDRRKLSADGQRVIEYAANGFHSAVVGNAGAVVVEVKEGPYNPETAKIYPDWAPKEGTLEALEFLEFMRELQSGQSVELFLKFG